jgi:hypothetical protein
MNANDFQVLISPVIGFVAALAIGWSSLFFILRRDKYLRRIEAAEIAKKDASGRKADLPVRSNPQIEPVTGL